MDKFIGVDVVYIWYLNIYQDQIYLQLFGFVYCLLVVVVEDYLLYKIIQQGVNQFQVSWVVVDGYYCYW